MASEVKTLSQFRATRQLAARTPAWYAERGISGDLPLGAAEYANGCFILRADENDYSLVIESEEYHGRTLEELEPILYKDWYLRGVAGVSDQVDNDPAWLQKQMTS